MSIKSSAEFEALSQIGQIVCSTLGKMMSAVRAGIFNAETVSSANANELTVTGY